jgi:CheY-like chemotaxis protein
MLHAPTDLHHSQQLLQDADRLLVTVDTLLAQSRVLVARGKARAEARAAAAVTYEASPAREGEAMAPQTPLMILLIDDEPSFVSALAQLLRQDGSTVDTATDGHAALTQLQAHHYDVVLCDVRMPGLDGPAFYARLCAQHAPLRQRVLFLTGDTLGADSMAFLERSGQPWVAKPCHATTIRSAIQQMLHTVEVAG